MNVFSIVVSFSPSGQNNMNGEKEIAIYGVEVKYKCHFVVEGIVEACSMAKRKLT
jgi:hypothetical protein